VEETGLFPWKERLRRLVIVVVLLAAAFAGRADAVTPGRDGPIVYENVFETDATHIWVANPDGSRVQDLTPEWEDEATDPAWSPNRRKIAFVSDRGNDDGHAFIWVMNRDGSGARALGGGGIEQLAPAWSPDGKTVAFMRCSRYQDGEGTCSSAQIATIGANGKGLKKLTKPLRTTGVDSKPAWSPNGKTIVFQRTIDFGTVTIWTIGANGKALRRILADDSEVDHSPSFSPTGKRVVYVTNTDGTESIYTMNPDGKARKLVVEEEFDPDEDGQGGGAENPAFAPSGQRIVYMGGGDLWTVGVDGTARTQLTQDGGDEPDWGRA